MKNIVGAESAGDRAGLERFTKILFGVDLQRCSDPGTRLDPNNPQVNSGSQHWPFVKQPFRSWPNALAPHAPWQQAVRHADDVARREPIYGHLRRAGSLQEPIHRQHAISDDDGERFLGTRLGRAWLRIRLG